MAARHRRAKTAPKAQPAAAAPTCADCGAIAALVNGASVYPHRPDLFWKSFYRCDCGAYVGCHAGTVTPLGSPAGPETRSARHAAHAAFDPLWEAKVARDGCKRQQARGRGYAWLAEQLGIQIAECHIGMMDAAMARRVVEICANVRARRAA